MLVLLLFLILLLPYPSSHIPHPLLLLPYPSSPIPLFYILVVIIVVVAHAFTSSLILPLLYPRRHYRRCRPRLHLLPYPSSSIFSSSLSSLPPMPSPPPSSSSCSSCLQLFFQFILFCHQHYHLHVTHMFIHQQMHPLQREDGLLRLWNLPERVLQMGEDPDGHLP